VLLSKFLMGLWPTRTMQKRRSCETYGQLWSDRGLDGNYPETGCANPSDVLGELSGSWKRFGYFRICSNQGEIQKRPELLYSLAFSVRNLKAATIRSDFPPGRADERTVRGWDKTAGQP